MTVEEVKKIIDEESLKGGNLFEKRKNKENEMVIMNVAEQWLVYATDERASKITGSEKKFKTEEEALDNFITIEKCCYTQCAFNITNLKIDVIM